MADNLSNITPPPTNVSSLVSPNILNNLDKAQNPKAFGDQLKNIAKQKAIAAATQSTLVRLYKEKTDLILEETQLDIAYKTNSFKDENQYNIDKKQANNDPQKLSKIEIDYTIKVNKKKLSYENSKKNLEERKKKNQEDINKFLADPFAKQKEKRKKRKEARAKAKQRTKAEKRKARQEKRKAILKNSVKTIVPILALLLTDKISDVISQNDVIKKLIDETNKIIIVANESNNPTKLNNAKLSRDNAIRIIQNNENKLIKINNTIKSITVYITVFGTIISIVNAILSLPIPALIPLKIRLQPILQKALKILAALGALLAIILVSFQKVLDRLNDYKSQLLDINGVLENKSDTTSLENKSDTTSLALSNITFGTANYGSYKGFKFAIREETGPKAKVVAGNKRHFAVAINTDNIEVLKSEPSFTLDPNNLIEQLKLVIDRENLIG